MTRIVHIKDGTERLFLGEVIILKEQDERCLCVFHDGVIWIDKAELQ